MSGFPGHLKGVSASSLGWQNLPGQATIAQNARGCREGGSPGHSVLAVWLYNDDKGRSLGSPPLPGWPPERHHAMCSVYLETLKSELTKTLTASIRVTHFLISQHVDRESLSLKMPL